MILARNEGRDTMREGLEILNEAARHCLPLKQALDTWGDVTFDYTSTDTPDFIPTATAAEYFFFSPSRERAGVRGRPSLTGPQDPLTRR